MDDEGIWPDWLLNRDYWQQVCWMAPILLPDHPVTMDDMLSAHHLSQLQQQWKVPSTSPPPHLSSFKRVCCGPLQTQTIVWASKIVVAGLAGQAKQGTVLC